MGRGVDGKIAWTDLRRLDVWMVAITLLATVLRLWHLGTQSLWYDEWLTTEATSAGPLQLLRHVASREGIGPTYPLVMWVWTKVFGDGEIVLRIVSAAFGIATIPLVYKAVVEFGFQRLVARLAALIVAVHPMLVWYSQEARPYSILGFLAALSLLALARVQDRATTRDYLVWGAVCAVGVTVHYFFAFVWVAEAVAILALARPPWRRMLTGAAPTLGALLVISPLALEQQSRKGNSAWIARFSRPYRLADATESALVGPVPPQEQLWIPVAAGTGFALVMLGLVSRGKQQQQWTGIALAAIGTGAFVLALMVTTFGPNVLLARYLIACLIPLGIAAAVGLTAAFTSRRWRSLGAASVAALVLFCGASFYATTTAATDPALQKPDWRAVADTFRNGSGDRLLMVQPYSRQASPLRHYLDAATTLRSGKTARVYEIDVLVGRSLDRPCSFLAGGACGFVFLGSALPDSLAADFTLEDTIELDQFVLERYRARIPIAVSYDTLDQPGKRRDSLVLVIR